MAPTPYPELDTLEDDDYGPDDDTSQTEEE